MAAMAFFMSSASEGAFRRRRWSAVGERERGAGAGVVPSVDVVVGAEFSILHFRRLFIEESIVYVTMGRFGFVGELSGEEGGMGSGGKNGVWRFCSHPALFF